MPVHIEQIFEKTPFEWFKLYLFSFNSGFGTEIYLKFDFKTD